MCVYAKETAYNKTHLMIISPSYVYKKPLTLLIIYSLIDKKQNKVSEKGN